MKSVLVDVGEGVSALSGGWWSVLYPLGAPGMRLLAGDRVESLIDRGVIGASHVMLGRQ